MRLATNNILRTASNPSYNHPHTKPGNLNKLSQKRYAAHKPAEESSVNNIVESISNDHNGRLQFENIPSRKKNLTKDESEGLNWLIKQTREDKIAVVKADKGGALLIVDPNLLEKVVLDKLNNSNIYNLLESNPTNGLSDELFSLWLFGKKHGYVSDYDAQKVMGITDSNNKSTSSHFKPGISYFYPMLKIYKLSRDELKSGVTPPARLVS